MSDLLLYFLVALVLLLFIGLSVILYFKCRAWFPIQVVHPNNVNHGQRETAF